LRTLGPITQNG